MSVSEIMLKNFTHGKGKTGCRVSRLAEKKLKIKPGQMNRNSN
jgi:hypothetical protein